MREFPTTFADDPGIVPENKSEPLFCLLCAVPVYDRHISPSVSFDTLRMMFKRGWTSVKVISKTTQNERIEQIRAAGSQRFDARTAANPAEMSRDLLSGYRGDLRKLRKKAKEIPGRFSACRTNIRETGRRAYQFFAGKFS